ncbi:putative protein kinase IRE1 family [Helianthus anomalus]
MVFYGVNPSDVTKQLIEADEGSSSKWTANNVKRWKAALTEAANLSRWSVSGHETTPRILEMMEDIARTIFSNYAQRGFNLHPPQDFNASFKVFISSRGDNEFTSALYMCLLFKGLKPFIDYKAKREGQEVTPEIQRYITEASASIVVLSEDFANSSYCLDELCLILQQKRNPSNLVLPVFYGVVPLDVMTQLKNLKIEADEGSSSKWTADNVNRWKTALTEAANLSRWSVSGHETTLMIYEIVEDIARTMFSHYSQLGSNLPIESVEDIAMTMFSHYSQPGSNLPIVSYYPPLGFSLPIESVEDIANTMFSHYSQPDSNLPIVSYYSPLGFSLHPPPDFNAFSSTPVPTINVFISLIAEDAHPDFITNLYSALTLAGIGYVVDVDIQAKQEGQELTPEIQTYIKETRASIIVFSKDIANSSCCLDELCFILEKKRNRSYLVFPVFYSVNPSDVKKQLENLMIKADEGSSSKWTADNVNRWKAAVTEAANLLGWFVSGHETTPMIFKIVNDIARTIHLRLGLDLVGEGISIGKLFVSSQKIALGSNGTVVFKGSYDGRMVAVKRLVQTHHEIMSQENKILQAADQHPNIVRWYDTTYDGGFIYLSLEPCDCSLYDLIQNKMYLESFRLKSNGYPSRILLKLMRDICAGLVHLHKLEIIHRDLKPHNVLIVRGERPCVKLADMGISKFLANGATSLGPRDTVSGTSGWRPREQILQGERQTRAMDMFSLGCVLFFCMSGGKHPFGMPYERDVNVINNNIVNLSLVEHIHEAWDLCSRLLNREPKLRPEASEVLLHPLFWKSEKRVSFLRDASDRLESEDRTGSIVLVSLENEGSVAFHGMGDVKMDPVFINEMTKKRKYRYNKVQDLLRIMRNTINHYGTLPPDIQELLGDCPKGVDDYFRSRFPKLLMVVYKVMYEHCKEEEPFRSYY